MEGIDWSIALDGAVAVGTLALAGVGAGQMYVTNKRGRQESSLEMQEHVYAPLLRELTPLANSPEYPLYQGRWLGGGVGVSEWEEAKRAHPVLAARLPRRVQRRLDRCETNATVYWRATRKARDATFASFRSAFGLPEDRPFRYRVRTVFPDNTLNHDDTVGLEGIQLWWTRGGTVDDWLRHLRAPLVPGQDGTLELTNEEWEVFARGGDAESILRAAWDAAVSFPEAKAAKDAMQEIQKNAGIALRRIQRILRRVA